MVKQPKSSKISRSLPVSKKRGLDVVSNQAATQRISSSTQRKKMNDKALQYLLERVKPPRPPR